MITTEKARELRKIIEAAAVSLDDKTASSGVELFPAPTGGGALIAAGARINWKGKLKRAAADLWDTPESTPDAAPTLWEDIPYRDGVRIIPEVITVGLAFAKGELGYWGDELYSSLLDNNVWTPAAYPAAWERVE